MLVAVVVVMAAVVVVDVLVGVVKYLQTDTDLDTKGYRYRCKDTEIPQTIPSVL